MTQSYEPILLCRFPGESEIRRFTPTAQEVTHEDRLYFGEAELRPWPGMKLSDGMEVCGTSTSKDVYEAGLSRLIPKLKERSGKTVICRQICGRFSIFEPERMALEYFEAFPDMFCFMFYHPSTGWWMGASPELLLEVLTPNLAKTRALAGTRPRDIEEAWSAKNIAEHNIVVEDICRGIASLGSDVEAEALRPYNFAYGQIEHLCTPILVCSKSSPLQVDRLIDTIHPTPAVCGYPRKIAISDISDIESYPRQCYGGLIEVPAATGKLAYVILRCVHFDSEKWCVYSGSGITPDSDPSDEWDETESKAAPLVELLKKYSY